MNRNCEIKYFDPYNESSHIEIGNCILSYMKDIDINNVTPVILCIGTDRATGDCLGPLVGEQLFEYHSSYIVMGRLSSPVHALNIKEAIQHIKHEIPNPFVIAVDAALGASSHIGYITVSDCPIYPGKGVHKKLPAIGDVSITGIVNISNNNPGLLQNTRLYTVMSLANCISQALKYSINQLETSPYIS